MAESYPLAWPEGWKRTQYRRSAPYKVAVDKAYEELVRELTMLGASKGSIVVSSNIPPRNAFGTPRNDGATVSDPGVATYWVSKAHGERVMACDRWDSVRGNIRAIGMAVSGLRAIERAGASQILDRAFTAFGALPASSGAVAARAWWDVLKFPQSALSALSVGVVEARYRELAAKAHPDRGGSDAEMAELNAAREQARAHYYGT